MKHLLKLIAIILGIVCIQSCNTEGSRNKSNTRVEKIEDSELKINEGEILQFAFENIKIKGVTVSIIKEEDGIWYGLCLMNEKRLFGRQIPSGLLKRKCVDMLDIVYIHTKALKGYEITGNVDIDRKQIVIGSQLPISQIAELPEAYQLGLERRTLTQTPCSEGAFDLDPVRECYFELGKIGNTSANTR